MNIFGTEQVLTFGRTFPSTSASGLVPDRHDLLSLSTVRASRGPEESLTARLNGIPRLAVARVPGSGTYATVCTSAASAPPTQKVLPFVHLCMGEDKSGGSVCGGACCAARRAPCRFSRV